MRHYVQYRTSIMIITWWWNGYLRTEFLFSGGYLTPSLAPIIRSMIFSEKQAFNYLCERSLVRRNSVQRSKLCLNLVETRNSTLNFLFPLQGRLLQIV